MVSRGEVSLIIGTVGLKYGMFPATTFPVMVLVIVGTAILTPPLVRWAFNRPDPKPAPYPKKATD